MTNHYHLMVETPEVGLSRGIHWLNQRYAQTFNDRYQRVGHLFQGRFRGILVERETHLLELVRYIVRNPIRAGLIASAGDYQWSNYRATAGLALTPLWLEVDWTLAQFNPFDRRNAREEYQRFVNRGDGKLYSPWDAVEGQIYLGGPQFRVRMQTLVDQEDRSPEHPTKQRRPWNPAAAAVMNLVKRAFGADHDAFRRRSSGQGAKALAMLLVDVAGLSLQEAAEWVGVSASAISRRRAAGLRLCRKDPLYRRKISDLVVELNARIET